MSALGHKRTCASQKAMSALPPIATAKADIGKTGRSRHQAMSALPPKADVCGAFIYVCFGP
jgi:hypothetical protein